MIKHIVIWTNTFQVLYRHMWVVTIGLDSTELDCHKSEYSSSFQNVMASHLQRIASSFLSLSFPGTFPCHFFPHPSYLVFTQFILEKAIFCEKVTIQKKSYTAVSVFLCFTQCLGYFSALVSFYCHISCL